MALSAAKAHLFLNLMFAAGTARNPFNPSQGASDTILDLHNTDPNAMTVGKDLWKKAGNPLLVDYGPAGMKFQNAIRVILNNPDDPAFAPYVKDLYSAGVALQKGTDQALMASTIGAYLRDGVRNYQSNMSANGDLTTGTDAWNRLDPSTRNALLVQFYKQGPTPKLALKNAMIASQNGVPYVPQIGVDGAGATYLANEAAISRALADGPASFSDRWNAINDRAKPAAYQRSVKDPAGRTTNPVVYTDAQGPVDPNLSPPAYIPEHLRYLNDADRVPATRREDVRVLRRMPVGQSDRSAFSSSDGGRCLLFHPTRHSRSRRKAISRGGSYRGLGLPVASLAGPVGPRRDNPTLQITRTGLRCGEGAQVCPSVGKRPHCRSGDRGGGVLELIHRIERVIVHPGSSSSGGAVHDA